MRERRRRAPSTASVDRVHELAGAAVQRRVGDRPVLDLQRLQLRDVGLEPLPGRVVDERVRRARRRRTVAGGAAQHTALRSTSGVPTSGSTPSASSAPRRRRATPRRDDRTSLAEPQQRRPRGRPRRATARPAASRSRRPGQQVVPRDVRGHERAGRLRRAADDPARGQERDRRGASSPVATTTVPAPGVGTGSVPGQDEDDVGVVVGPDEGDPVALEVGPVGGRQVAGHVQGREQAHARISLSGRQRYRTVRSGRGRSTARRQRLARRPPAGGAGARDRRRGAAPGPAARARPASRPSCAGRRSRSRTPR